MNCAKCGAPLRARSEKCAACGADSRAANLPAARGSQETRPAAPTTRRIEPVLLVTGGPDKGAEFPITRILTMIGRQEGCDIVLQESVISREHGQIEQTPEGYVYINLSDNGSWVNRKRIDRALLKDGDSVELGARTRLKFVLREVEVAQVGPVFKRRARQKSADEQAEQEQVAEQKAAPSLQSAGKSLLKRRKLVIGVGAYLLVMVVVVLGLALSGGKETSDDSQKEIPQYTRKEQIVPFLNLSFDYQIDAHMAREKISQGHSYYERRATGDPNYLYLSVRCFSEAQAYMGGTFDDQHFTSFKAFDSARNELAEQIWQLYWQAWQLTVVQRKYDDARECYRKILQMLSDPEATDINPLYEHVETKMARLPGRRR